MMEGTRTAIAPAAPTAVRRGDAARRRVAAAGQRANLLPNLKAGAMTPMTHGMWESANVRATGARRASAEPQMIATHSQKVGTGSRTL